MLNIVYEDRNFVVLNKPSGIVMHTGTKTTRTLVDELAEKYPEIKNVGDDAMRPGLVHRLDKNTSGIVIVAKTQEIFFKLKEMFKNRLVSKVYLAIACGNFKEKSGQITFPIGRLVKNPLKRAAKIGSAKIRGERSAESFYKILSESNGFSLVEIIPKTGRMHQIRVHLKAVNHPVACDYLYGGKNVCCLSGVGRQLLHAWKLSFSIAGEGNYEFQADPPEDFIESANRVGLNSVWE